MRTFLALFIVLTACWTYTDEETKGVALYKERRFEEAIVALTEDVNNVNLTRVKALNLAYLAKCYEATEKIATAEMMWELFCRDFPNNLYAADGYYFLACRAKARGNETQSRAFLEKAAVFFKRRLDGGKAALALGDYYLQRDEKIQAWEWYSQAIRADFTREEKHKIKSILDPLVEELLFYHKVPASLSYVVQRGDNLVKIARKFQTTQGMICWLNHKQTSVLAVGEQLTIIASPVWIEVSRNSFFLVALFKQNGLYLRGYEVGIGETLSEGTFAVSSRIKQPQWYVEGKSYAYDHPDNPLGTRWIGFKGGESLGIHGTNRPDSIGQKIRQNAVQMHNKDIEFLFEMIALEAEVVIK